MLNIPEDMSLEDFALTYQDIDFNLRLRKLKGETLSQDEMETLAELNAWLDRHLPKPEGIPEHIRKLVDDILSRPEP